MTPIKHISQSMKIYSKRKHMTIEPTSTVKFIYTVIDKVKEVRA